MVVTHLSAECSSQNRQFRCELGEGVEVHIHHNSSVLVHLIYLHFAAREREELHSGWVFLVFLKILNRLWLCAESDVQHDLQNETRLHRIVHVCMRVVVTVPSHVTRHSITMNPQSCQQLLVGTAASCFADHRLHL